MQLPPQLIRIWQMVTHAKAVFFSPTTPPVRKNRPCPGGVVRPFPLRSYSGMGAGLGVMDDLALIALLIAWANGFSSANKK